jgi:hypothetical protein
MQVRTTCMQTSLWDWEGSAMGRLRAQAKLRVQGLLNRAGCRIERLIEPVRPIDVFDLAIRKTVAETVPVEDSAALAAARRLLGEPGLRERLSEGARRRARGEFDDRLMGRRSLNDCRSVSVPAA